MDPRLALAQECNLSSQIQTQKVVVLGRGMGTRMIKRNDRAGLNARQAAVADTGIKALLPVDRPFLDYVLTVLADAGYRQVCLVIGPEHHEFRDYYGRELQTQRFQISFAVQDQPLGTADAVLAAEEFVGSDEFVMINSDNYYPLEALSKLYGMEGAGLAVFERESMIAGSNVPSERVTAFAVVRIDQSGCLQKIIEKPDEQTLASIGKPGFISMNCWRFTPLIFRACRNIKPSVRGELEVPDAVQYAIDNLDESFKVIKVNGAVLDLSYRSDVMPIALRLANAEVNL